VGLSLYKGNIAITTRQSEYSLYQPDLAGFTMGEGYDQKDAAGFIRILGLPARSRARARMEPAQQTKLGFAGDPAEVAK
jgi:argininosuccinate synthase